MNKTSLLVVRLDPETKDMAARKAEVLGLSVSAYVRMLVRTDNLPRDARKSRRPT